MSEKENKQNELSMSVENNLDNSATGERGVLKNYNTPWYSSRAMILLITDTR
jgi:hypothetical protein